MHANKDEIAERVSALVFLRRIERRLVDRHHETLDYADGQAYSIVWKAYTESCFELTGKFGMTLDTLVNPDPRWDERN
tara:strand:- start:1051 stop:1284 length:234 start_codon:yes stop_codon:yes gene_type:complete